MLKTCNAQELKFNMEKNSNNQLEDSVIMYETYTMELLDKIVSTINATYNKTTHIKNFTRKFNELLYNHFSMHGIVQFTAKTLFYICIPSMKF